MGVTEWKALPAWKQRILIAREQVAASAELARKKRFETSAPVQSLGRSQKAQSPEEP